jgi:LacI family transcriptional regulator
MERMEYHSGLAGCQHLRYANVTLKSIGIRAIAQKTRLSLATVSRALRNLPSVRPATRRRVEGAATALGYRCAPLVGAVLASVRRASQSAFHGNLAVLDVRMAGQLRRLPFHDAMITGARRRARSLGFALDVVELKPGEGGLVALARMLRARGALGIIVVHQRRTTELAGFPWDEFAVTELDPSGTQPALHSVGIDHHEIFTEALERLAALGYRRAGLFVEEAKDARLKFRWTAAFRSHQANYRTLGCIPVLTGERITEQNFLPWFERHRPDLLIGHRDSMVTRLKSRRVRVPQQAGFFNLNWNERTVPCAGFDLRPELAGQVAVESVVAQIHRHEHGVPADPQTIMIRGQWVDGPTLMPQNRK